jgi:hypothetical protein
MEHPPYSPDLASNDLWLPLKIKFALKRRQFQDMEDIKKKKGTTASKDISKQELKKMFPTEAASLG